jgi:nucleoid-associated protein YgaU/uncharacterized protein YneF (UPF0154 family)
MTKKLQKTLISLIVAVLVLLAGLFGGLFDSVLKKLNIQIAGHPAIEAPAAPMAVTPIAPAEPQKPTDQAVKERVVPVFDLVRVEPSGDAVIAGQGMPGSKVEILSGSDVVAAGKANDAGAWAIVLSTPLKPGAHDLSVRVTSPSGETITSAQSVAVSVPDGGNGDVLVVLNRPGTPSEVLQKPGLAEAEQRLADAGVDAAAVAAKLAEPVPAADAKPAAPVSVDAKADAAATPATTAEPAPVAGGETSVAQTAPAAAVAADASATTSAPVVELAPAAATMAETASPAAAAAPVVATAPTETSPAAVPTGPVVTIDAVEVEAGKRFYAAGSAPVGAAIRLYVDDKVVGDSKTQAHGRWLFEGDLDLAPGKHVVRADEIAADGKVLARAEVPFDIAADLAVAPIVASGSGSAAAGTGVSGSAAGQPTTVIIRQGDNLWTIAKRLYGQGIRYSTIYQANTDQIRNPDLIYPGQVFVLPKGDAAWTEVDK